MARGLTSSNVNWPVAVAPMPSMQRRLRRPVHTFLCAILPFAIQPFMIAPVWPRETMKNLLLQCRAVTDPITNPIVGWWLEHYFFYVKLRDLYERDLITEMLLNPSAPIGGIVSSAGSTAKQWNYYNGGSTQIDWVELCMRRIIDEYFRDEGDNYTQWTGSDTAFTPAREYRFAQFVGNNVMDSVFPGAAVTAQDVTVIDAAGNDVLTMSELEQARRLYEVQQMNGLTEMSFEDYLAAYGIRDNEAIELHRPELLRYSRSWQYPSNTIDPTNGTPRSAVSWSISERADKDRMFREPGFIVGVVCCRPKVYLGNQLGTFSSSMNSAFSWLPAVLTGDKRTSLKQLADDVGPVGSVQTDPTGYWFDVKDLAMYGEQFLNLPMVPNPFTFNAMATPNATLANKRYPISVNDVKNLFVDRLGSTSKYYCRMDGVVNLSIASTMRDTTPRGGPGDEA